MKNVIIIFAVSFSFTAIAQDTTLYCAKLKENKEMLVMSGQKKITSDVVLPNGNIIRTYGSVLKTDGRIIVLRDGECIDLRGNLIRPKTNERFIKEEKEIVFPPEF